MSSSGINLSSLLSALGSSSSGIDVTAAVAQAISAESGPLTQMEQQQSLIQSQTGDINQIETDLSTLQSAVSALSAPVGALTAMTTASSNSGIVTATAASDAVAGNHVIVVSNLATTGSWYTNVEEANATTTLPTGSFTLTVGTNAPITINTGSGTSGDTLNDLASYINGLGAGVTANVVTDSGGARLAIVSNSSGAANNFTITNATGLAFTQAVKGVDASLTVDGIPIDSASNTVSGAVSGVTFNLLSASPGTQVDIGVTPDSGQISTAVSNFVSAYNTVIGDVNQEYKVASNGAEGPLAGDPTLAMLQSALLAAGSYTGGGNGVSTLADLGITMNDDGTLTLDTSTLNNAVEGNFSAVQNFLQGTSSNGFADNLNTQLDTLTDPTDGAFTVDLQSLSSESSDIQTQINNFQTYLDNQTTLLTNEFDQADIALQQLPIEEQQLNAELGNPTTNNNNNGG
jgi:flagellar hook-associated protein 2